MTSSRKENQWELLHRYWINKSAFVCVCVCVCVCAWAFLQMVKIAEVPCVLLCIFFCFLNCHNNSQDILNYKYLNILKILPLSWQVIHLKWQVVYQCVGIPDSEKRSWGIFSDNIIVTADYVKCNGLWTIVSLSLITWYQKQLHPCVSLQWRHNERDGVSNHQPHDCLLNRLFRRRSNKTSKLRVTGLCAGNRRWPVAGHDCLIKHKNATILQTGLYGQSCGSTLCPVMQVFALQIVTTYTREPALVEL